MSSAVFNAVIAKAGEMYNNIVYTETALRQAAKSGKNLYYNEKKKQLEWIGVIDSGPPLKEIGWKITWEDDVTKEVMTLILTGDSHEVHMNNQIVKMTSKQYAEHLFSWMCSCNERKNVKVEKYYG